MKVIRIHATVFVAWVTAWNCEGELPVYRDPRDVLSAKVSGEYVLSSSENSLKLFLSVKNTYDETLEGAAVLQGKIDVILVRNTAIRKTFSLTSANLIYARSYNASSRILRLDPEDSVKFMVSWDFVDDNGVDLREHVFAYSSDPSCLAEDHPICLGEDRRISSPEEFSLDGEITIYEKVGMAQALARNLRLCYVDKWVNTSCCPPISGCIE
ncbi:MAG: hypothetical protein HY562_10565 [Ignavibacteriales bacterium]|nr:hypothetical protein [Ignavibacteriales bacterium]